MAENSNPRNKQATLFKRLTRLFSGPIVNYNKQQIKRLKSTSIKNYTFTTSTGKEFKKKEYYNLLSPYKASNYQSRIVSIATQILTRWNTCQRLPRLLMFMRMKLQPPLRFLPLLESIARIKKLNIF